MDLASAELEVAESREELNSLMGLWGENVSWSVASPLPDAPANPMKLEGLEKIAIENSIDLALARQKIIAIGKQLGIAKATKLVPSLDLGMEIEHTAGDWATGPLIGFEIPIFNRNQGKIATGKSELRRRQQEFHALGVEIRAAVRAARRRLTTARQPLDKLRCFIKMKYFLYDAKSSSRCSCNITPCRLGLLGCYWQNSKKSRLYERMFDRSTTTMWHALSWIKSLLVDC